MKPSPLLRSPCSLLGHPGCLGRQLPLGVEHMTGLSPLVHQKLGTVIGSEVSHVTCIYPITVYLKTLARNAGTKTFFPVGIKLPCRA
jgi:hypothetical protein